MASIPTMADAVMASQAALEADRLGSPKAAAFYKAALEIFGRILSDAPPETRNALETKKRAYERRLKQLEASLNKTPIGVIDHHQVLLETPMPQSNMGQGKITAQPPVIGPPLAPLSPPLVQGEGPIQYSPFQSEFYEKLKVAPQADGLVIETPQKLRVAPLQPAESISGGRRGETSLKAALELSRTARQLDSNSSGATEGGRGGSASLSSDKRGAFVAYMQALDYYADAARHGPPGILASINRLISADLARAEELKSEFEQNGAPRPDVPKPPLPNEETVSGWHSKALAEDPGVDLRISSLTQFGQTNFWNDKRPLRLRATLSANRIPIGGGPLAITIAFENESSTTIEAVQVSLRQHRTSTNITQAGRKVTRTSITPMAPQNYRSSAKFPMGGPSAFTGRVTYSLPVVDPTDADNSASFALEYDVAVTLRIARHDPLTVTIPIRILRQL